MPHFVEVILPLSLSKTFTYSISEAEFNYIQIGMRLAVPFGKNKLYTALAIELHQNVPELYEPKEIDQILDEQPVVTKIQIAHWQWIASYYMAAIGDVFRSAMPASLLLESETIISFNPQSALDSAGLTDDEFQLINALQQQGSLKISEAISILDKKNIFPSIRDLLDAGIIALQEEIVETYKPKKVNYIKLAHQYDGEGLSLLLDQLKNSERQKNLVLSYFSLSKNSHAVRASELVSHSGATMAIVKTLVGKGIFELYQISEDRVNFEPGEKPAPQLSDAQQAALEELRQNFEAHDSVLLHGVTASGKTEIYIKLIEEALGNDGQVLYLLPEIALTTQLVSRLTAYFGNKVSVYHSKYTNNERVEAWKNVLLGSESARIVIGARSSLFLPFKSLKLIIIDEEHEQMFKQQDPSPRYHARDSALVLAKLHNSKVLMGSATPALETYHNAKTGKFGLVELSARYGDVQMPEIELVDLKDKYFRKQMTGHFSDLLIERINQSLLLGEQVILFQNRRGFSPVVECTTCGHVPQCRQCDVSLTYHKNKNQLRCHYCGYAMAKPQSCHACSSVELTTKGFGTEQVQLELAEIFPQYRSGRMDQDTTKGKYGFERIIDSFKNKEIDILVGTQMLAKGLDFNNVSLVGIMNADNMLYHPDFRAFERSYQMMSQVSGRSGRSVKRGKVVIQTYNPEHNIIRQVTRTDYTGMFAEQMHERKIYQYPPFFRLIRLTLKHRDFEKLRMSSQWLFEVLHQNLGMPVLGPEEPPVSRIRNEYIRTILIKIPPGRSLEGTKKTIRKVLDSFESVSQFRAVRLSVNVDVY